MTLWYLGWVVQKVDNAIYWINLYPVDSAIGFPNTYRPDSDLSKNFNIYSNPRKFGTGV